MPASDFIAYTLIHLKAKTWKSGRYIVIAPFVLMLSLLPSCSTPANEYVEATGGEPRERVEVIADYQAVLDLYEQMHYTDETWIEGHREIPRIYFSTVPPQWGKEISKEVDITLKKRLFFRAIGPLILRSNELIQQDRDRLLSLKPKKSLSAKDAEWVTTLAETYRLKTEANNPIQLIPLLLKRVDIIPPTLILAQAAEESGWGTSRFAFSGNALFGQWTWGDNGMKPKNQRDGMGDYKIARFTAPLQSVQAHALNLNSHAAYRKFRELRAQKRKEGTSLSGLDAATTLDKYSERGKAYVKSLQSIIKYNKIKGADQAYLAEMDAIVLVPADQLE